MGATQTCRASKRAHSATLGRMRSCLKEWQKYEIILPSASPSPLPSGRAAQPNLCPPCGPSLVLTSGSPCRGSWQRSRGRCGTRSSFSSPGALGRCSPWPAGLWRCRRTRGGCWGCPGEGEEEAAESERGEAAWRCLIREICASWAHTRLPLGRKLGGPENQKEKSHGGDSDGDSGVLQPSPCPAPRPPNPPRAVTLAGMVLAELCSPAETSLC